jgi:hypothetical protein
MKQKLTLISLTNLIVVALLFSTSSYAQVESTTTDEEIKTETPKDSLKTPIEYGLRIGLDLSKPIRSYLEDDYNGFEINADFRITKKWYAAIEIGSEKKTTSTNYLNSTASGNYFKIGGDYNMYKNWLDMKNMIYSGLRIGHSKFSQQRNSFTVYSENQFWEEQFSSSEALKFEDLSATWAEVILGIKAEVLPNVFVGINAQLKYILSQDQPDNFQNLYVPGYNKTYDGSKFGVGFGYNISYLIPLLKK